MPSIASELVRETLRKFPKASTSGLARKLYKENGSLWTSMNACELLIRRCRGKQGVYQRDKTKSEGDFRQFDPKKQFKLPEPIKSINGWGRFDIDTSGRWLIMSDIHIPHQDPAAINAIIKDAKKEKIAGVLLNGDIADCYACSHWQTDPRQRDFPEELDQLQEFMGWIRKQFPHSRIVWKWGNHEERFNAYMMTKAPELLDVPEFQYEEISHAGRYGIEVVKDKRPIKLGKLFVLHGHEYKQPFVNPVSAARAVFLKARVSTLVGHVHEESSTSKRNLDDHRVTCWSTGCLCDLHPEYRPLNDWGHGAAVANIGNDGAYEVMLSSVIDGKVYRH